jgi:ATP-dependent Zn protease
MKKSNLKIIIFYFVLIMAIIMALSFMFSQEPTETVQYSDVLDYFESDAVKSFVINDSNYIELTVYTAKDASGAVIPDVTQVKTVSGGSVI